MPNLIYLSAPYSTPDPVERRRRVLQCRLMLAEFIADGRLTICPVSMNHEAIELLNQRNLDAGGSYWRSIEAKLAEACDELVVLRLPNWEDSNGVRREIALFEAMGKPVSFVDPRPIDGK